MNYVLGINAYHGDAAACLVVDGHVIAAAEEERFNRVKHWAGFPVESIKYCLKYAGIDIDDINSIAINHDPKARLFSKFKYSLSSYTNFKLSLKKIAISKSKSGIRNDLKNHFPLLKAEIPIKYIEHHRAHLASAYFASNFKEAVCLSIDGFGDFASASWGVGTNENLRVEGDILFPDSLGIFYQSITQFLGFSNYGDEYKVMGLASYGSPELMDQMKKIVFLKSDGRYELNLKYFRHTSDEIQYKWQNCEPSIGSLFSDQLIELLGSPRKRDEKISQRHMDIAASCQKMYELALFNLLNHLQNKYKLTNLCLAGGCAMNSVANGRIYSNTKFKKIYIQPAGGDAGGAVGAAFSSLQPFLLKRGSSQMQHAYWGPEYSNEYVEHLIEINQSKLASFDCAVELLEDEKILQKIAKSISEGKVIGWFQNRMEWGPRALGNRSILGDPRRADMKDILNKKIKRRESFRPFAPSIMQDKAKYWFDISDDVPFMGQVSNIYEAKRAIIPAVTHVDGTGRLQTVSKDSNSKFYKLIEAFEVITGVPILLNTSFNENEPIVCSPDEALACFLRTNMDMLAIGNYLFSRA
jgi:carbamoyltransferase